MSEFNGSPSKTEEHNSKLFSLKGKITASDESFLSKECGTAIDDVLT